MISSLFVGICLACPLELNTKILKTLKSMQLDSIYMKISLKRLSLFYLFCETTEQHLSAAL